MKTKATAPSSIRSIAAYIIISTCVMFLLMSCVVAYISYKMYREAFYNYSNELCLGSNAQAALSSTAISWNTTQRRSKSTNATKGWSPGSTN